MDEEILCKLVLFVKMFTKSVPGDIKPGAPSILGLGWPRKGNPHSTDKELSTNLSEAKVEDLGQGILRTGT